MTGGFSQVIGSGGFSTVYFGRIGGSGQLCAVKVLRGSERLKLVFRQELDILLRLRHPNIVRIVGCCDEREEGALVFEFVSNGNLQERLHCVETAAPTAALPWINRLSIAYQLARAIEYLHDSCDLPIVHGDVKSSNILLDEHLNCRLCDFGSAKVGFSATGIASKKNDIYSFGVVVLELITGMEAFVAERGQMLTSIVAEAIQDCSDHFTGKLPEIVDPRLGGDIDLGEARTMISIARMCLNPSSSLRPSASHIIDTMRKEIPSIRFEGGGSKSGPAPRLLAQQIGYALGFGSSLIFASVSGIPLAAATSKLSPAGPFLGLSGITLWLCSYPRIHKAPHDFPSSAYLQGFRWGCWVLSASRVWSGG
ncbi:hypothetical protein MLD38_010422 [Melastoma candidum]|uniref:Uncharacterized protein n=1 Tax=Melastoma candidum TaxID=119954 RepID=A0ACB9QZS1_9MYRT|nr:hypothetical protein MLD38_010422 [Melastoma candidum]